ncbi:MAG: hypothetical protein HY907_14420 [Deltaproteobacteria bacterium]|nr:hypothetical protein [Deltaproteobacteria bacterium]
MTGRRLRFDLLGWAPVRTVVRWIGFPLLLQAVTLAAAFWLAGNGLGVGVGASDADLLVLRRTNLTTLLVWGLWWPGMILGALLLGRVWCTVCPLELVQRLTDVAARRVGWPRLPLGRVLGAGWLAVLGYVVLQVLVAGLSLHRSPHLTALMILAVLGLAVLSGLLFRHPRSFCRAFCPAAPLLSVYGRYTALQLDTLDPAVCESCGTRDCVAPERLPRLDRRGCPSRIAPFARQPSDGCVLCLQCAKTCPKRNLGWGAVPQDAPVRGRALLRPVEAAFVAIATGFVAHEAIGEVRWLDDHFHALPARLGTLVPAVGFGWIEALWFLALFPAALWCVVVTAGRIAGDRSGLRGLLLAAATGAAPVVAVAHAAKAAVKLAAWAGFVPLALDDPQGVQTLQRLARHAQLAPVPLLGTAAIGAVMFAVLVVAAARGSWWVSDVPGPSLAAARTGLVSATILFGIVLFEWAWPIP